MQEHNLLIVSDLHLSEGCEPKSGKFCCLEDFLFDDAFARFLRYHEAVRGQPRFGGRPWLLVINGDLFDFLQVVVLPEEGRALRSIKGVEQRQVLRTNEQDYGLGTTAGESAWKLRQIARGHPSFFAALGRFVAHGNTIAVVKGNHDVELHWPRVRERLITEVARAYARERRMVGDGPPLTPEECQARLRFYPWYYYEPGWVYVEHGGQYDTANHFRDYLNPVLPHDPERIELPWGSMFVRYVFNKVEDVHPFADNVKPCTRYLGWAFRKDPLGTTDMLLTRGWVFLRASWNVTGKTLAAARSKVRARGQDAACDAGPLPSEVGEKIAALAQRRVDASWQEGVGSVIQGLLSLLMTLIILTFVVLAVVTSVRGIGWMAAVYVGAAVLAYFLRRGLKRSLASLFESHHLQQVACELAQILQPGHAVRYVVLGHEHRAAVERLAGGWYANTGAWVPVYEEEGPVEGREDLTFLRLAWGSEGAPELLRWDDAAGEPARAILRMPPRC